MEWAIVLSFHKNETDECGSSTLVALPQSVWLSRQVSQSHLDSLEVNVKSVMHVVRSHSLENVSIVCALFCKITPGGVPQDMNSTAVRSAFNLKIITSGVLSIHLGNNESVPLYKALAFTSRRLQNIHHFDEVGNELLLMTGAIERGFEIRQRLQ